ncbi:hypothetical protein WJX73_010863 [Symbiochloris irregularis]|uniref:Uncharacterized protein n=1 Tax=Symbiochloris irregularis TaxID=706552 RepID=A0AAW1NRP0_9CHLO
MEPLAPPQCAGTYIANGQMSYNDIANEIFPRSTLTSMSRPGFDYNYLWPEISQANACANVSLVTQMLPDGTPGTPVQGSKLLIPPCRWGIGCRAVVPINTVVPYGYVTMQLTSRR